MKRTNYYLSNIVNTFGAGLNTSAIIYSVHSDETSIWVPIACMCVNTALLAFGILSDLRNQNNIDTIKCSFTLNGQCNNDNQKNVCPLADYMQQIGYRNFKFISNNHNHEITTSGKADAILSHSLTFGTTSVSESQQMQNMPDTAVQTIALELQRICNTCPHHTRQR